ncbi:MAG: 7,8-didemethyl-8-hydroxy-5-deazariboflavin synthase subunit CofH, partial [Deltaproteobacteria bacterium]|nr:7,8-didemethyl-8-hydroxy-5-deazariboflavin synthase subunit CofH [Deltaproteobacteria bacterium]
MTTALETCLREVSREVRDILERALEDDEVSVADGIALSAARGVDLHALCLVADELRRRQVADSVTYV